MDKIEQIAEIFTEHSIKIEKGNYIVVSFGLEAKELAVKIFKKIMKKGAVPVMKPSIPDFTVPYYELATNEQLIIPPMLFGEEAKKADGWISISCENNTKSLTNVDSKKLALRRKSISSLRDPIVDKNNWLYFEYPTEALAQDSEMSLEEFKEFIFNAVIQDWEKIGIEQDGLKKVMDEGKNVEIIGKNTNLTFSIENRKAEKCYGKRNMPDGEVYIAPVETTVNGYVEYSFPAVYSGKEVEGIKLKFKEGKVIEAKAEKNEELLKELLEMDEGAKFLGEWGVGTNYNIKKFTKQILFDEKMGGTTHLALGRAYKKGGGKNDSALHWDMILDLRKEGKILIDGKVILENGELKV